MPVKNLPRRLTAALAVLAVAAAATAQTLPREVRELIVEAVVEVNAYDIDNGTWAPFGGSGTIISSDGFVLTNYHVIGDDFVRTNYEWAGIFVTNVDEPHRPPQHTWWARYVAGDPRLDFALLQIVEDADENPVPVGTVFPTVQVGNSDALLLGDPIIVVGYPSISGSTITFTQGVMSGWVGEDMWAGGRRWIKTDAKIARGSSGGAGFNEFGELVGVPTAGYHELDDVVYEEQLFMRPINLAWPLLAAYAPSTNWSAGRPPAADEMPDDVTLYEPPSGPILPFGTIGPLRADEAVTATLEGRPLDSGLMYHTYTLDVTTVPATLTITASSIDDIDLAIKLGGEILSYAGGDVDFMDFSFDETTSITFEVHEPVTVYIDVVNQYRYPIEYTLVAEIDDTVLAEGAYPPPSRHGHRGSISPGRTVLGNLAQHGEGISSGYHTYTVEIPLGTRVVEFVLEPESTLGLAVKFGSDINNYSDRMDGGDWDRLERTGQPGEPLVFEIMRPRPGTWFIDVINYADRVVDGRYRLTVNLR